MDQLEILVKPLTKSELEVEAKAWMDLLRAKAKQIASARLGVKKTNEAITAENGEQTKAAIEAAQVRESKTPTKKRTAAEKEPGERNHSREPSRAIPRPARRTAARAVGEIADVAADKKDELLGAVTRTSGGKDRTGGPAGSRADFAGG